MSIVDVRVRRHQGPVRLEHPVHPGLSSTQMKLAERCHRENSQISRSERRGMDLRAKHTFPLALVQEGFDSPLTWIQHMSPESLHEFRLGLSVGQHSRGYVRDQLDMVRAGPQTIAKPIGQRLPWMRRIQPPFVRGEALNPSKCKGEFRLVVAESRARGYPDARGNSFG